MFCENVLRFKPHMPNTPGHHDLRFIFPVFDYNKNKLQIRLVYLVYTASSLSKE